MIGSAVSSKRCEAALYITGFRRRDVYQVGLDFAPETAVERLRYRTDAVRSPDDRQRRQPPRHASEVIHRACGRRPDD